MAQQPLLIVDKLSFLAGKEAILREVSFTVQEGEFITVVGPSGAGKSTLLKILAGLLPFRLGQIFLRGVDLVDYPRKPNLMFQKPTLLPWLNVFGNVAFGLKIQNKVEKEKISKLVREALRLVGLLHKEESSVGELSGGEAQRVALARSLVLEPEILLLDEPFSALDVLSKEMLQYDLLQIVEARKITTILVSHFLDEAIKMSDRILFLDPRLKKITREFAIKEAKSERGEWVIKKYLRELQNEFRELAFYYNEAI